MNKDELKEKIKKENSSYISEIDFAGRKYVKVLKNEYIKYEYYEIINEQLIKVTDEKILNSIKNFYEDNTGDIIY